MNRRDRNNSGFTQKDVLKSAASRYRRRRLSRAGVAVILCVVLFIGVFAASIWHITKRVAKEAAEALKKEETTLFAEEEKTPPKEYFDKITVDNGEKVKGDLILVNYQYPYTFPENEDHIVKVFDKKNSNYGVAYGNERLEGRIVEILNDLTDTFYEKTGDKCVLIRSAYRSLADQQSIYDSYLQSNGEQYVKEYVATPGQSEHHTGIAFDLNIRLNDGTYVAVKDYEHLRELNSVMISYGFVQRYTEAKYPITLIKNEPWHYRYVGIPHSYVMTKEHYCLEEYVEYVKAYSADGEMLYVNEAGEILTCTKDAIAEKGYLIYYVPVSEGTSTEVKLPKGAENYTVSGNNVDGFIVTVTLGEVVLPEVVTLP